MVLVAFHVLEKAAAMSSGANGYYFGDSAFYVADAGQQAAPAMLDVAGGGAESWTDAVACHSYLLLLLLSLLLLLLL